MSDGGCYAYAPGVEYVDAIYCKSLKLREYVDNPLISALGPIWSVEEWLPRLCNMIPFSEDEIDWPREERIHAIGRLSELCIGRGCVGELASLLGLHIRRHYIDTNPAKNCASLAKAYYKEASGGRIVPVYAHKRSHAGCMGIFGISGIGKTTAVETALRFFPKVIRHPKYGFMQVVWIKVQCAKGALLRDSLIQLISQLGDLVDIKYLKELGPRPTIPDLCNKLARVCRWHYTGLIWIDEIQNAFQVASKHDPYLDFFVNFTNVAGTPILMTGTPTLSAPGRDSLRLERRLCSAGRYGWEPLSGRELEYAYDILENLQWLKGRAPLSAARRRVLSDLSQGIMGILIPLYQLSQIAAVRSGIERLTSDVFRDVSGRLLAPVRPMLNAIKKGEKAMLLQYNDLLSRTIEDIEAQVAAEAASATIHARVLAEEASEARMIALCKLMSFGIPQDTAYLYITTAANGAPQMSAEQLAYEAAALYFNGATSVRGRPKACIRNSQEKFGIPEVIR